MAARPNINHRISKRSFSVVNEEWGQQLYNKFPQMDKTLKGFETCVEVLSTKKHERDFPEVYKMLESKIEEPFEKYQQSEQRVLMGNHLSKINYTSVAVDYYIMLFEEYDLEGFTDGIVDDEDEDAGKNVMIALRTSFWNFSDGSHRFGNDIGDSELLKYLEMDLQAILKDGGPKAMDEDHFAFHSAVGIITNCARSPVSKTRFRENKIIPALVPFLQSKSEHIRLLTLLGLAHTIDDNENHLLTADNRIFDFMLTVIKEAWKAKDHRSHGLSSQELIDGLAALAQNDGNKKTIMAKGALGILKKVVMTGKPNEQESGICVLWELAFLEGNRNIMKKDKDLMQALEKLKNNKVVSKSLSEAAHGACFVIEGKNTTPVTAKPNGEKNPPSSPATQEQKEKHVMISYNWADQKTLIQVRDSLVVNGFKVWMDIDNMEGSLLQAMAEAVENAAVVLVCYSEKYKISQNCRTEAEYSFQLRKPMIPLRMQQGYVPDGWLGICLGTKLFYDFSGKYPFDQKMHDLLREMGNQGKKGADVPISPMTVVS
ncbi:hypothetical protein ScPMuIL_017362 [Solemya velum]